MRKALRLTAILTIYLLSVSCSRDSDPGKTRDDFIIAGYLPYYGMERVDMNILRKLDQLYYFSITPDDEAGFIVEQSKTIQIQNINNYINKSKTKLYLVVGGWYESENIFQMAADPVLREHYITELIQYCTENEIDGVDLDWESYPVQVPEDDFKELVFELSDALRDNALEFSLAMSPSQVDLSAEMISKIDYVNVMSYGIMDQEGNQVPFDMFKEFTWSHVTAGIPKDKIIMGVPFYAKRPYKEGDTSPTHMIYRDIADLDSPLPVINRYHNYSYNGKSLIEGKTRFLFEHDIRGIMAWELSQDVKLESNYSLFASILSGSGRD